MTIINITTKIEGSSSASIKPIRIMAVTASLSGKASAMNEKRVPKEKTKS